MTEIDVKIMALGSKGDGIAETDNGRLFIPFAVPGDRVRVRIEKNAARFCRGKITSVLDPAPQRLDAACEHFSDCGGCSVQQLSDIKYQSWKLQIVKEALSLRKIETPIIKALIPGHISGRRRIRFSARRLGSGTVIGFKRFRSNQIVDVKTCPVTVEKIYNLIPALRELLNGILQVKENAEVAITASDSGLDITLLIPKEPNLSYREIIANFAVKYDIARICWKNLYDKSLETAEPVIERRAVMVHFGKVLVKIPPDAFLQPTVSGEKILSDIVFNAVKESKKVIELFSGCGAFSLPLANRGIQISAFDLAEDHIFALLQAARDYGMGERVTAETRDLYRRPLDKSEFDEVDAIILNPPRSGAISQIMHIAESRVPMVVYVSCNPNTFARDVYEMTEGGYKLQQLVPVDQFLWSHHIELVGVLKYVHSEPH